MKKKLLSLASMIRKNWWIAGLCVFFAVAMIILSGFAISASNKAALYIGEERAKAIALEHAGISAAQVTFIKAKLSREDGRIIYDVEFYGENTEYDYEIDAMNGRILEADLDIENYVIPGIQPNTDDQLEYLNPRASSESYIGEERAKSIALEHAGVSVPQVTFIKAKLDYDDGR